MDIKKNFMQATQELLHTSSPKTQSPAKLKWQATKVPGHDEKAGFTLPSSQNAASSRQDTGIKTVISKGTCLNGDISCDESMDMLGELVGDITGSSVISMSGKVTGCIECKDIDLRGATVKGDIKVTGEIVLDAGSSVLGNVYAQALSLDGKIKGDVQVLGALTLLSNAVVLGKIHAGSLSVQDGAIFSGEVQMQMPELTDSFAK